MKSTRFGFWDCCVNHLLSSRRRRPAHLLTTTHPVGNANAASNHRSGLHRHSRLRGNPERGALDFRAGGNDKQRSEICQRSQVASFSCVFAFRCCLCFLRAFGCGAGVSDSVVSAAGDASVTVELLNVSCDPTLELWNDLNDKFITQQSAAGRVVSIKPSHRGSRSRLVL